ncbi:MAG: hypothetical protein EHM77_02100 [Planctomycetaceae bacterium]|nr:MAG: hypothetical protein EHM77_02100 [Planctomycetaceae bacterium]
MLEWSGRQLRSDQRGAIAESQPDILERLRLAGEGWLQVLRGFHGRFRQAAGSVSGETDDDSAGGRPSRTTVDPGDRSEPGSF